MRPPALGVIPARIGSARLPRKPLVQLAGRPLLQWVWEAVATTGIFDALVVATDSDEIARAAAAFGARVQLTAPEHPSGTDRVAEVARIPRYGSFPVIVNVQGDEPFIDRQPIEAALRCVRDDGWEIGTVATRIRDAREWRDPSIVKVVRALDGGAMLFSRAPVPRPREGEPGPEELAGGHFLRHLGLYAYTREALFRWVDLPEGDLERLERLEQLRPLAAGARIGVAEVEPAHAGIDTPADVARAEPLLRKRLLHAAETRE